MTILHVSDFHFNKRWFNWLLHRAPPHDLVVMSGDMLNLSDPTPQSRQIAWVSEWLNGYPRPFAVCSGNHDLQWDSESERWTPAYWLRELVNPQVWTDGQRIELNGLAILNIGCTTRPKGGRADIWVVHAAPSTTLVSRRTNGRDGGDPDLLAPVRRYAPRLVLSGHVHHPQHWREQIGPTLFLNPGRTHETDSPNHILVNMEPLSCQFVAGTRHQPVAAPIEASIPDATVTTAA